MKAIRALGRVCSLIGAAAAFHPVAAQTTPGWSYKIKMAVDSGNGAKASSFGMTQYITPKAVRMEMSLPPTPGMRGSGIGADTYMIVNDADSSFTMVMPEQHMAMVMGADYLSVVRQEIRPPSGTKGSIADLGPGEAILGHATHKYRLTATAFLPVTVGGASPAKMCDREQQTVVDMWMAPDIDFDAIEKTAGNRFGSVGGVGDMMSTMGVDQTQIPKGAPLRMIVKTMDPDAPTKVLTATMTFTDVTHGPIADSLFTVPAGFGKEDMRSMMTPEMLKAARARADTAGTRPRCAKTTSKP